MILGLGVDLFAVARMARELGEPGFVRALFTSREISYCERQRYPARHFAARFAAKEAVVKSLAVDGGAGICWRDVEVCVPERRGPSVVLHGHMKAVAAARRVTRVFVSMSSSDTVAIAGAVLEA